MRTRTFRKNTLDRQFRSYVLLVVSAENARAAPVVPLRVVSNEPDGVTPYRVWTSKLLGDTASRMDQALQSRSGLSARGPSATLLLHNDLNGCVPALLRPLARRHAEKFAHLLCGPMCLVSGGRSRQHRGLVQGVRAADSQSDGQIPCTHRPPSPSAAMRGETMLQLHHGPFGARHWSRSARDDGRCTRHAIKRSRTREQPRAVQRCSWALNALHSQNRSMRVPLSSRAPTQ
jgi:hypothetical protein